MVIKTQVPPAFCPRLNVWTGARSIALPFLAFSFLCLGTANIFPANCTALIPFPPFPPESPDPPYLFAALLFFVMQAGQMRESILAFIAFFFWDVRAIPPFFTPP